jgi:hypothetical protein
MSLTVTVQKGHDFSSGNVTRAALNAGAVPTVAVTGSVSTTELIDGAITTDKLGTDSVEEAKIKDLAVTAGKLGAGSVVLGKLGPASVVASNLLVLKDATLPANANIIDGLTPFAEGVDVAVDDYLMVLDTSAAVGAIQLKKAKVSQVQKVGTTEYVMSAQDTTGGATMGGSGTSLTVAVDMDGSPFQTVTLVGGSTYTFAPLANRSSTAVKTVTLKLTHSGSGAATLAGHTNWNWPERESGHPTSLPAGKSALLSITSFGTADGDVMAAYAVTL